MTPKEFTIVRELDAPPQRIWDAWVDPDQMAAWMQPDGATTSRESIAVDLRVGGRYAYTMVNDTTGEAYPAGGEYLELEEPNRLVMSWGEVDDSVQDAMRITVQLEPVEGRTRLTFTLQGAEGAPGDDDVYDGWDAALANLRTALGS
jgi:uncharacterized protein YndB with AHSA1/START domain